MLSYYFWSASADFFLSVRILTLHSALYRRLRRRGNFKDHRSAHWHASGSGSWANSFVIPTLSVTNPST